MPKEFYSNICAQNWVVNHTSTHRAASNESPGHSPPPGASSTFSRSLKPHSRPMTPLYDMARDANTRRHFLFSSVLLLTIANTSKSQPFLMPIDSLMVMCSPGLPFCWSSLFWWFAFSKTCLSSAEPARGHHKINLVDIGRKCSCLSVLTFRIFVQMCDVFSLVSAYALGADLLTYFLVIHDFPCAPIVISQGVHQVCVHLREHKRSVVFEGELALFDRPHRNRPAAEHAWETETFYYSLIRFFKLNLFIIKSNHICS